MAHEEIPSLPPTNLIPEFHLVISHAQKTIPYAYTKTSHAILFVAIASSVQLIKAKQQEQVETKGQLNENVDHRFHSIEEFFNCYCHRGFIHRLPIIELSGEASKSRQNEFWLNIKFAAFVVRDTYN